MTVQSIEQLKSRFQKLNDEKTRVKTLLDKATKDLEKMLCEAEEKFGTRDLDELKSKLQQLESENEKMKQEYQNQLDSVENRLADLESECAAETIVDE